MLLVIPMLKLKKNILKVKNPKWILKVLLTVERSQPHDDELYRAPTRMTLGILGFLGRHWTLLGIARNPPIHNEGV